MSVVTLEGELIHYEVLGRGRPIIFLHGWVGSWRYWVPTMQAASMGYRAYALDLWGFGDTAKRPQMYRLTEQVALLNNFMEALGIGRIALVGHGLGAMVALQYAAQHGNIVDRVMLTGLPIGVGSVSPRLRTAGPAELSEWLLGRLPATESARGEAPKADQAALLTSIDDLQAINVLEACQRLSTACLLVHGQSDPAVQFPPPDILNTLPEQTHYIIFEQSGHFPMLDEPSKYQRLLGDFLALASGESPRQLQLKEEWKRRVR
jgi:pimeloyl-ACP methyl ester carboxylesterase